jgi:NAD(P)H-flavin reductase
LRPVVQTVIASRRLFGDVSLLYGARNEASLLFRKELDEWKKHIRIALSVDEVEARDGKYEAGPVTVPLRRIGINPDRTVVFVCGPELMMRFTARELLMKRVPQSGIFLSLERRMHCGVGHCGHCQQCGRFVCKDGPVFPYREVHGLPDGLL